MPESNVIYKKDRYNVFRKEICDDNDTYMPKHTNTLILCLLEDLRGEIRTLKEDLNDRKNKVSAKKK